MRTRLLLAAVFVLIFSTSCRKSHEEPYIYFKHQNGSLITEQIVNVPLNSEMELYVDVGFEEEKGVNNLIHYLRKIDDHPEHDLTFSGDLQILVVGAYNNLTLEKSKISLSFDENTVKPGSQVIVTVKDSYTMSRSITFKVEEESAKE